MWYLLRFSRLQVRSAGPFQVVIWFAFSLGKATELKLIVVSSLATSICFIALHEFRISHGDVRGDWGSPEGPAYAISLGIHGDPQGYISKGFPYRVSWGIPCESHIPKEIS